MSRRFLAFPLLLLSAAVAAIAISTTGTAATQASPTNTQPPTIGGTPEVGKTLAAREGTWTGNPTDYDYAWRRCDADGKLQRGFPGHGGAGRHRRNGDGLPHDGGAIPGGPLAAGGGQGNKENEGEGCQLSPHGVDHST